MHIVNYGIYLIVFYSTINYVYCKNLQSEWKNHNVRVLKYKCNQPQPKVMEVFDLIDDINKIISLGDKIYPPSTYLHRCDSAGCCGANKWCQPNKIENVHLVFSVIDRRKAKFLEIQATNHTNCSCQNKNNQPK